MTRRPAIVVGVAVVFCLSAAVVLRARHGDGDDGPAPPPSSRATTTATTEPETVTRRQSEIEGRLAVPGDPVPTATAIDALQWGIGRLLQSPAVEVDYDKAGTDPGAVKATAVVLPAKRSLDQQRVMTLENGAVLTEDRRVVDGIVYVRTDDGLSPDLPAPWDRAPSGDLSDSDVDRTFTAEGAAGTSLADLPDLLRAAPFSASRAVGSADGTTIYRLRAPTANGTPTAFEFTLGTGGVLTSLSTYGTVLVDGEALAPVVVDIRYRATSPRPITAPPAADLRH